MALDLTFRQVTETLKQEKEPKLIEAVDTLLDLAKLCAPVVLGPAASGVVPVLSMKDGLVKLGKRLFHALSKQKQGDYLERHRQMETAYGLLCFTAFFDALDQEMPTTLRGKFRLLNKEKLSLAQVTQEDAATAPKLAPKRGPTLEENPIASLAFPFPHPTETLDQQTQRLDKLWSQLAKGFGEFIQNLVAWDEGEEKEKAQVLSVIADLPKAAALRYEAQYVELARQYPEFAIWANLHEHKRTKALIGGLSQTVKQYVDLAEAYKTTHDIGLERLHQAVVAMPQLLATARAEEVAAKLARYYKGRLNEPIIENKGEIHEGGARLCFPPIREAFVPQSFRVLRQEGTERKRLEVAATWEKAPRRDDLAAFLLSYFTSPYSTETPLVILGHPGSGKSLLTKVLSAQLMSDQFTVIRVTLRDVNADANIVSQIEKALAQVPGIGAESWHRLSARFQSNPPIVILDGYDELLQASGLAYAEYLKDVQHFQQLQAEQEQPVRVIVTSRITLIDKATIPEGTTIVRLLEFDQGQRERWISIWNAANAGYFLEKGIEPFALPAADAPSAEKILSLAEQPLLLLMLALYDSDKNQVHSGASLDRTSLYHQLLRRFVERERRKDAAFRALPREEKDEELDAEMYRLGVVALGMYNRRQFLIRSGELDGDLKFFGAERKGVDASMKSLRQADLLLSSFFFIHKSESDHSSGVNEQRNAAFEFLHNTFGEFLTADILLRHALDEVTRLRENTSKRSLLSQRERQLHDADGLSPEWFAGLISTPLFTRPVVLEMMREWLDRFLASRQEVHISRAEFVENLETLIVAQLNRLLNRREMPQPVRTDAGRNTCFGDYPLLGHVAIYSINLILLRAVVEDRPFVFDESHFDTHGDGTRPWDRLIHLWRSWFSLENLHGVTAVLGARRDREKVAVQAKPAFRIEESHGWLETYHDVATAIGDDGAAALSGLVLFEPEPDDCSAIADLEERLLSATIFSEYPLFYELARKRVVAAQQLLAEGRWEELADALGYLWGAGEARLLELESILFSFEHILSGLTSVSTKELAARAIGRAFGQRVTLDIEFHAPLPLARVAFRILLWSAQWERGRESNGSHTTLQLLDRVTDNFGRDPRRAIELLKVACDGDLLENYQLEFMVRKAWAIWHWSVDLDVVLQWLEVVHKVVGDQALEISAPEELFTVKRLQSLFRAHPNRFAMVLRMERFTRSTEHADQLGQALVSFESELPVLLPRLPLSALPDLRWVAKVTGDFKLQSALQRLLG